MNLSTTPVGDSAAVVHCDGRLTMVTAALLLSAVQSAIEEGRSHLVLDLEETSFVDSSGLGALISGLKQARQAGGDLRIAAVAAQVHTVLSLTNLDRILRPYDTVGDATVGW